MFTPKTQRKRTSSQRSMRTNKKQRVVFTKQSTGGISKTPAISTMSIKRNLRYTERQNLNAGLGTCQVYVYRANSCHDPNQTGIGHQPRGYDQYMALYTKWVVTKAKITVHGMSGSNYILGVDVSTSPNNSTDPRDHIEQKYVSYVTTNNQLGRSVSQKWDLKDWKKGTNIFGDDAVHGASGSNPFEEYYFNVFAGDINFASDPGEINLQVVVEYEVVFFDPLDPLIS